MFKPYSLILVLLFAWSSLFLGSCTGGSEDSHAEATQTEEDKEDELIAITAQQMRSVGIELREIEYKDLSATIRANGSIHVPNSHKAYTSALYGGLVQSLSVHPGDRVRKGQVIARLANPQFVQLQEEYLTTQSRIIYAREERKRQEMLEAGAAGAAKDLQSAIAELASLEARLASLKQQLYLMGITPESISTSNIRPYLDIISPLSGVVSKVMGKIGAYVDASTPLAEIIDNSGMHLEINIYEQDLAKIKPGQIIHFRLTNCPDKEYDARVYSLSNTFEPDSRTIAAHCDLLGDISGFIDGMNITGIVSLGQVSSPALPDEAIIHTSGRDVIYVLAPTPEHEHEEGEGHDPESEPIYFRPVEVVRGASQMGYTALQLLEELPQGTKVACRGAFFVHAKKDKSSEHAHAH
ncbi:efflux RND transporter periplasmic adaptor subunit [Porphyromonas sp. COT-239 OH1446]|uniref:efflux RND transporter periplasmic adaptor subunit n=1 Tax=Porphyromonas sp. COT-239 OH1446 TaxID=1515613 RepID=UPI00052CC6E9|nr:efflux RND transporter periplasmic adaptor subunit [Porphyromonas sp. COT-239 OH1446]KGN71498.1 hypothetical protein HQ37_01615 [Porphyromonas sp. COT-239 OH1446]